MAHGQWGSRQQDSKTALPVCELRRQCAWHVCPRPRACHVARGGCLPEAQAMQQIARRHASFLEPRGPVCQTRRRSVCAWAAVFPRQAKSINCRPLGGVVLLQVSLWAFCVSHLGAGQDIQPNGETTATIPLGHSIVLIHDPCNCPSSSIQYIYN